MIGHMPSTLPSAAIRTEMVSRTARRLAGESGVDCGFITKLEPERGYRNRVLPRYVAVYLLRGSGTFTGGDRVERRVQAGDVIQHRPGERCSVVPDGDGLWAEFFVVAPVPLHAALTAVGSLDAKAPVLHPGVDGPLVASCEALLEATRDTAEVDDAALLVRVHELLVSFQRLHERRLRPRPHEAAVAQACAWLAADLPRDIHLPGLAALLNLSYERFRKVFRDHVGVSPGEYRIRRRIDAARALIAHGGLTNKEVAFRLGYPDPFTFSKQFKRYVGVSPDAFRRTA